MMTEDDVVAVMARLTESGIDVWLDGGWGVDALLAEQTRDHDDLDLVVALDHIDAIRESLSTLGYGVTEDERPTRVVLTAPGDRRIDLHTVEFDGGGGGVQALPGGRSYRYPPEGFLAEGSVGAKPCPVSQPKYRSNATPATNRPRPTATTWRFWRSGLAFPSRAAILSVFRERSQQYSD
jgi:lincosamide nucleotidyltransferase A/C/D/E